MNFHFPINDATFGPPSPYDLVNKFLKVYCKNIIPTSYKILSISALNCIRLHEDNLSTFITSFDIIYLYLVFFFYLPLDCRIHIFLLLRHLAKDIILG